MSLSQPVVCPVLIGRGPATEALAAIRSQAAQGSGRVVLISGEAGIGKSRVLAELRSACLQSGWQVLEGNCFEQDQALPYSAWTDLFRRSLAGAGRTEALRALGRSGAEIARLLPDLFDASTLPDTGVADPQQQKQRLIQEVTRFLTALAASAPLAVLIEDVHWADESTLDLLVHAARALPSNRMLLVATYRSDEPGARLGDTLTELNRQRIATELTLDSLQPDEVREMLRATLGPGRPVRQDFAQTVYALTEGNPFFIEEVLRSLAPEATTAAVGTDLGIPRSVREAVRRRVQGLSEPARRVAEYAAVAGRRFDFPVLSHICRVEEPQLLELIKELIAAQLIVEQAGDEFAFRHALTREAIYSGLLARERRLLHGQIAATIEELNAENAPKVVGDLAYHFFEAEAWAKALYYGATAAAEADRAFAPRAAVEQYSRAIEAAGKMGQAAPSDLHRRRGLAFEATGRFDNALVDQEKALALARDCGDRQSEWQALIDLGMLWSARDYSRSGEYYKRAFDLAEAVGDGTMRGHSMNRLGNWHLNVEQPVEALHYHRQALQLFESQGDRPGVAATLDLLGMSSLIGGDLSAGLKYYREAIGLFRELDDRPALVSALTTVTLYGPNYHTQTRVSGDLSAAEALAVNQEALDLSRAIGWKAAESYALWNRGMVLGAQGRYSEALDASNAGLDLAEEIEHRQWTAGSHYTLGAVYLDLLAFPEAAHHLTLALENARAAGTTFWLKNSAGLLASTHIAAGHLDSATATLSEFPRAGTPARTIGERLLWVADAELALAQGRPDHAVTDVEWLLSYTANLNEGSLGPRLCLVHGLALRAAGRSTEAKAVLEQGIANAASEGSAGMLWRLLVELADLSREQGYVTDARAAFERALETVRQLAPNVPEDRRDAFLAQVARMLPAEHARTLQRAPPAARQGVLTPRETGIAALVSEGKSNRAIAGELVLSERTVETHVSNILTKLSFSSRSQIAAWAVESRLAEARLTAP